MSLISLIVVLIVVGILLWAVEAYLPMDATLKRILVFIVIVAVCLWLLSVFGILPNIGAVRVGW